MRTKYAIIYIAILLTQLVLLRALIIIYAYICIYMHIYAYDMYMYVFLRIGKRFSI